MTTKNKGNKVYLIVGIVSYIVTTAISAFLNIYLFMNLDASWKWFTMLMSLSLEALKAFVLIRANTYRSLREYLKNCKFPYAKVQKKMWIFYGFYLFFAVLSITAGLMFSLSISDKTEQGFTIERQAITQNIATLTESRTKYSTALEKYTVLQENSDAEVKRAKEEMWATEDAYNEAGNKLDAKSNEIMIRDGVTLSQARNSAEYRNYRNTELDYDGLKKKAERAKDEYNSIVSGAALVRAKNSCDAAETEYKSKTALLGDLDTLNLQLSELNKKELENAGSSKGFILLAQTFGIPERVKQVKFLILLLASLLIEVGIWVSSPDLKLDGALLYSFRNDIGLDNEKDVKKLMKEIENSNNIFSVKVEEKPRVIEKDSPKTLKELDNLKEQIVLLNRQLDDKNSQIADAQPEEELGYECMCQKFEEDESILEHEVAERETAQSKVAELQKVIDNMKETAPEDNSAELMAAKEEIEKLKEELSKKDNTIAELNERPIQDENKKYTEEDVKKAIKEAMKKSKEKIADLTAKVNNWEQNYDTLSEKASNLELANHALESRLQEATAEKEIDQVLNGEITNSEIDKVLEENKKNPKVIKSAEDQINDMLGDLTNDTKTVKIDV